MCAPLYDDKGIVRYFIGAQIDVTGLIADGAGVESFRALLQKVEQQRHEQEIKVSPDFDPQKKDTWQRNKVKQSLCKLQELSMMFSQDESDTVNKHIRGAEESDAISIRSGVPTSTKNRGKTRRYIGGDELQESGMDLLQQLKFGANNPASVSLPGVYKYVSSP